MAFGDLSDIASAVGAQEARATLLGALRMLDHEELKEQCYFQDSAKLESLNELL